MGTRERREKSDASDRELVDLFRGALLIAEVTERQIALAAVGGFGRGELSPGSIQSTQCVRLLPHQQCSARAIIQEAQRYQRVRAHTQ